MKNLIGKLLSLGADPDVVLKELLAAGYEEHDIETIIQQFYQTKKTRKNWVQIQE